MTENTWEGLLEPGEVILWHGAPDGRYRWSDMVSVITVFGVVFTLVAVGMIGFIVSMADINRGVGVLVGLPFVAAGLYISGGRIFVEAWDRQRTYYTLTDRAAYIATGRPRRRTLDRYELQVNMPLGLQDGDPGMVYFAEKTVQVANHSPTTDPHSADVSYTTAKVRVGFEHIKDPRTVFALLRDAVAARTAALTAAHAAGNPA